jgi:uncharacterized membrane protein
MKMEFLIFRQRILLLCLFAAITTLIVSLEFFNNTNSNTLDYLNHLVAIENAKAALLQGQFLLRTMPLQEPGWSYPYFQFYSVFAYFFAGVIELLLKHSSPLAAYWITLWLSLLVGSIYTYRLIHSVMQARLIAMLCSVIYLTTPYYITLISYMDDFTEAVALGILPAVLYYSHESYQHPAGYKNFFLASLTWYLFATTHLISFFYTSLFLGLFFLLTTLRTQRWKSLCRVASVYFFGCVLASWFLAPILFFKKYLNIEAGYGNSHIFTANKTSLIYLVWPWSLSEAHPNIGLPILFAVLIGCFSFFRRSPLQNKAADAYYPVLLFLFFLLILIVWTPWNFWQYLPKPFLVAQYSWRLLAQMIWIGPLLFALAVGRFMGNKLNNRYAVLGIILILLPAMMQLNIPLRNFQPVDTSSVVVNTTLRFNPHSYLTNNKKIQNFLVSVSKKIDVRELQTHCKNDGVINTCEISMPEEGELIELPIFYYPDLLYITLNGKTVEYKAALYQNKSVATVYSVAGNNIITMQFKGLTWANDLSFLTWGLALVFLLVYGRAPSVYPVVNMALNLLKVLKVSELSRTKRPN